MKVGPWEQIAELDDIDEAALDFTRIFERTPMSFRKLQMSLEQSISNLNLNINNKPKDAEIMKRKIEDIDWKFNLTKHKVKRGNESKHLAKAVYPSQDMKVSKNIARTTGKEKTIDPRAAL